MKIYLILTLIAVFVFLAILIRQKYLSRQKFFEEMDIFCLNYINHINFLKTPLPKFIENIIPQFKSTFKDCLEKFYIHLNNSNLDNFVFECNFKFHETEYETIISMFKFIGRADVETEISNVSSVRNMLQQYIENSKTKLKKEGEIYFKLCILLGVCLAIMIA